MRRGHPPPPRCRSQAFSASQRFASTPGLRGLVSCRSRPWGSPFRALLLARVAHPSRGRSAPLRFSVAVPEVRCSRPRPPGFTALTRPAPGSPRLPPELGRRFRRARARLPRRPGPRSPGPPRSCGFVRFEAFDPSANPRSRPPVARRPRADALLGFRPSRAFVRPEPRALAYPTDRSVRRGASVAQTRGATSRLQVRPLRPRGRVDLVGAGCVRSYRTSTRAASRRQPCLPRPWQPGVMSARRVALGGVKDSISQPSIERWLCSPGVSCLFGGLATSRSHADPGV